jgi:SSS family solute:Na+ symporter
VNSLWIVFCAYLVATLLLGELAARFRIRSLDDFLLAGRAQGTWVTAGTLAATVIGGGSTLGAAGVAYYVGISASWYLLSASIGLILLGSTLAPALRRLRVYTIPEFIERRYGSRAALLAGVLGLIGLTLFLAAQLFALGSVISELAAIPRQAAILVSGVVVIVYTWRGGIWAIHWSDNFQLIWIVTGLGLATAAGLHATGGWEVLETPPPAAGFEDLGRTWFNPATREAAGGSDPFALGNIVVAWIVMSTTWHFAMQSTAQRVLAARDPGTARRACMVAAMLLIPLALLISASGMAARVLHPGLEAAQGIEQVRAFPALVQGVLSPPLAGVVLAALAAVIMSTSDSALLGASTVWVRDVAPRVGSRDQEGASIHRVRRVTILLGVVSVAAALAVPTLIRMLEFAATVYCVSLFVPLLAGLYWRRASEAGALAAMLLGACGGAAWRVLGGEAATGVHMLNVALPLSLAAMVLVSLASVRTGPQ